MRRGTRMTRSVAARPTIWIEAVRALLAMATPGWWQSPPFVPSVHRPYLGWREATAYGDAAGVVDGRDLRDYLRWRGRQRRLD